MPAERAAVTPGIGSIRTERSATAGEGGSSPVAAGAPEPDYECNRFDGDHRWDAGAVREIQSSGRRRRDGIGRGHGNENRSEKHGPDIQSALYDKTAWHGDGPVDLPLDYRGA